MTLARRHIILAGLFAGALALSACASSGSAPDASPDTPTTFSAYSSLNTLDPLLSDTIQNDVVGDLLYDSIIDYDSDSEIVPRVATEWAISDDFTQVDLVIRDDILFTSGNPLTAADVVYSLDRVKAAGIGAASFLGDYESSVATDDTHVTITLKAPNATFLGALSKIYVVDSAVVEENAGTDFAQAWLAANTAGSGAYTVVDYTQATSVKMALNPDYWDFDDTRPDTYVLQNFEESAAISTALRGGALNLGALPTRDAVTFDGDPGYAVTTLPSGSGSFVYFNTAAGPTADPKLREAIALAYDYQGHVDTILGGAGTIAKGMLPATSGCVVDQPEKEQDIEKAKALVAEIGAEGTELTLLYQPNLPEHAGAATLLQSNLRDIGINLVLQTTTFPAYTELLNSIDTTPDLAIANDRPRYPDAFVMLNRQFNSSFVGTGVNKGQYSNPEVDALLAEAKTTPDAAARCDILQDVEQILADDVAAMPLANPETTFVSTPDVQDIVFSPVRIWFDPSLIRIG